MRAHYLVEGRIRGRQPVPVRCSERAIGAVVPARGRWSAQAVSVLA